MSDHAAAGRRSAPTAGRRTRALVYAHWDRDGVVDDYVIHSLRQYRPNVERIVFVSTNHRVPCPALDGLADVVVTRENLGFDFGSWREGLGRLDVPAYDEILFANSSVYGPLWPLAVVFASPPVLASDLWGMTISVEPMPHLQSYFMGMSRGLLTSACGQGLWHDVRPVPRKQDAINLYELRWMNACTAAGFRVHGLFDGRRHPTVPVGEQLANLFSWPPPLRLVGRYRRRLRHPPYNPTHLHWKQVLESGVPFVKVDLLRDNPVGVHPQRIRDWIATHTSYPEELIRRHLDRVARGAVA